MGTFIYKYFFNNYRNVRYIKMPKIDDKLRELPKSLQGIETILIYLRENEKKSLSIRNISLYL